MLNLNELAIFLAAAECCNYTEAGRRLGLSQPAISQTIDSLEKYFGEDLFQRQGRSVCLTESGHLLQELAQELLATAGRLEDSMAALNGLVQGEMRISCATSSGRYLLPEMIARYRRKYPKVTFKITNQAPEIMLKSLVDGEVMIGMSSLPIEHHDLEYSECFTDEIVLITPSNHHWVCRSTLSVAELLEEPLIMREPSSGTFEILANGLHQHDILPDMLTVSMELSNAESVAMAVENGCGPAFISRLAAAHSLALRRVVETRVAGLDLRRSIYLVRNKRIPFTRAQTEFWDFAVNQCPSSDKVDYLVNT